MSKRRTKAYYRSQRRLHIKKKKHISESVFGVVRYDVDGKYDKGTVRDNCITDKPSEKTHSDMKKHEKCNYKISEWLSCLDDGTVFEG